MNEQGVYFLLSVLHLLVSLGLSARDSFDALSLLQSEAVDHILDIPLDTDLRLVPFEGLTRYYLAR